MCNGGKRQLDQHRRVIGSGTKTENQTPFRLAFQSSNNHLGVLGQYALSYQLSFEANPGDQLTSINRACENAKQVSADGPRALNKRITALSSARDRADDEIHRLAPELAACPATAPPTWPARLAITGLMTPWDAKENPYGTEVFYNWTAHAQRTRVFPYSRASLMGMHCCSVGADTT
jgi:hypothetical protein